MIAKQASIKQDNISPGWSLEAGDFINKLLMRKPEKRLGYRGAYELMRHPWLKYYPWKDLYNKKIQAPFIPMKKDNFDKRYCDAPEKIGMETKMRYAEYKGYSSYEILFENFTYYNIFDDKEKNNYQIKNPVKKAKPKIQTNTNTIIVNSFFSSQNTFRTPITYKSITKNSRPISAYSSNKNSPRSIRSRSLSKTFSKKNSFKGNNRLSEFNTPIKKSINRSLTPNKTQKLLTPMNTFKTPTKSKEKSPILFKRSKSSYGSFGITSGHLTPNKIKNHTPMNSPKKETSYVFIKKIIQKNNSINRNAYINKGANKPVMNIVIGNIDNLLSSNQKVNINSNEMIKSKSISNIIKNYKISNNSNNSTKSSAQSTHKFFAK